MADFWFVLFTPQWYIPWCCRQPAVLSKAARGRPKTVIKMTVYGNIWVRPQLTSQSFSWYFRNMVWFPHSAKRPLLSGAGCLVTSCPLAHWHITDWGIHLSFSKRRASLTPSLRMWYCESQLVFSESLVFLFFCYLFCFLFFFVFLRCLCACSSGDVQDACVCFHPHKTSVAVSSICLTVQGVPPICSYTFFELWISLSKDTQSTAH